MAVIQGNAHKPSVSGVVTLQSLKFNDNESQYLSWTPAAAGNRKTWTWSGWVKRGNLGSYQRILQSTSTYSDSLLFNTDDTIIFWGSDASTWNLNTSAKFRDVSAWYHFVISVDTTQATSSDRIKIYVNGNLQSLSTASYPSQNLDCIINNTQAHYISGNSGSNQFLDGYLSDINFIDGQALDPTSFGQFTDGYWEKKDYAGTYGTNGFHLTFEDDVVSEGFNAVTYTGNGTSQSVSGLGLAADLVWIKNRDTTESHTLFDTIRGAGERLFSNLTSGDNTASNSLTSFDADGFSVGSHSGVNTSGHSNVAWAWDAGSGSAASNTDGSITSTVKANPSYGFSITSFVGTGANATVGHGLSSAPDIVILKNRSIVSSWLVRTQVLAANQTLLLENTTTPIGTDYWQNTQPDSSVFSVSSNSEANGSGNNLIAYCFNSVAGYSSIGSYSGNGSTSNSITGLGFKPAFLLIKNASVSSSWYIFDNTRDTDDVADKYLRPNISNAEGVLEFCEFTADGFDITSSAAEWNGSGNTILYMAFADTREAAFWKDVSGQGNHWQPNNLDYRDSLIDSPANNFAVLNPLEKHSASVLSEGNLVSTSANANDWECVGSTMHVDSGKWYCEIELTAASGTLDLIIGVARSQSFEFLAGNTFYTPASNYGYYAAVGDVYSGGALSGDFNVTYGVGDVIGIAIDMDNLAVYFSKNGTYINSGDPTSGASKTGLSGALLSGASYQVAVGAFQNGTKFTANFGQDSTFAGTTTAGGNADDNGIGDFAYAPPSGYLALCTANLPTPTIVDGSEHFNTVLYTGNSTTGHAITGVGFQPDWVWLKGRNYSGASHSLTDSVRGATKRLISDGTNAEATNAEYLQSFDADGFTVGTHAAHNASGYNYVAWNWKAGGTAVSNTDGSITSQVSANVDAGFSITSYVGNGTAGATIGHSLGVAPDVILVKDRSQSVDWHVYHSANTSQPETEYLILNQTLATIDAVAPWNDTAPTSSVFTVGNGVAVNTNGNNYIAYCFANSDIIKAGSFTGNGSTDGTFVYTGFRPAWIMTKRTDSTGEWWISDTSRNTYNPLTSFLWSQSSGAEASSSSYAHDNLSNGFKLRTTYADRNASGATFIFLAFAENPFKYANAR